MRRYNGDAGQQTARKKGTVETMEKIMVVIGIWGMCALCALLFIRGASAPVARRKATRRAME
ncbi:hypothetical protein [Paraburkholderia sp.]|uniref:hypothetical protein n=1 Tax=Paraburkholderia sp. TaxID=1926495 RepID=UPI0025F1919E|nr:hypothetical protein [Paraburkholderia sp.]